MVGPRHLLLSPYRKRYINILLLIGGSDVNLGNIGLHVLMKLEGSETLFYTF